MLKKCAKCKKEKSFNNYTKAKTKIGLAARCRSCKAEDRREEFLKHPERVRAYKRKYVKNNPERRKKSIADWYKNNPGLNNAQKRFSHLKAKGLVPSWLTLSQKEYMEFFYICAKQFKLEVDHIIPLKAGGKHIPCNLQFLTRELNSKKRYTDKEKYNLNYSL